MHSVRFEEGWFERPMQERLEAALERFEELQGYSKIEGSNHELRKEQVGVFSDFVEYLAEAVGNALPFGRVILPPRTGKTVIAGQIIRASQLTSIFLVPTRTLVEQTARELEDQLPGTLIALYYGETKELTGNGVIVMTYQIFQRMWKEGTLPEEVKRSSLIIADEAHHAMTKDRMTALQEAFDPHAIRLALTASPDYEEHKQLKHFFPDLIHQISIQEALELGLLAKMKAHVHEVDVDASSVKIVDGDFAEDELGRLMSGGPFFELVRKLRYDDSHNGARGCLIACKSRQQAYDLVKYLLAHRPEGASPPALLVNETPSAKRREAIEAFDVGKIDTIIQVGVLLEGWNAPRCKLLIDLAPTISLVRATQKFFRPLTKCGDLQARIHLILPKNLKQRPILPQELIFEGSSVGNQVYLAGKPMKGSGSKKGFPRIKRRAVSPIREVSVQSEVVMTVSLERPLLNKEDPDEIRDVLESSEDFNPSEPPTFRGFRNLFFNHYLFKGRGSHLMRFLDLGVTVQAYRSWMMSLYPDHIPDHYLREHHERAHTVSCYEDARVLLLIADRCPRDKRRQSGIDDGWRTLFGPDTYDTPSPDEALDTYRNIQRLSSALNKVLREREHLLLTKYYGIDEESERPTYQELSELVGLSRERVRQVIMEAKKKLAWALRDI